MKRSQVLFLAGFLALSIHTVCRADDAQAPAPAAATPAANSVPSAPPATQATPATPTTPATPATPAAPAQPAPDPTGNAIQQPNFKVRADVFAQKLVSPQAFMETVPGTFFDQARNFPSDWGRGFSGFGKRFGSQYGQFVISELIVGVVSAVHHEDPRYYPSTDTGIWKRTKHAIGTAFVCRNTSGGRTIALSMPAGVFGAWAVATAWSPPDVQGPVEILKWGSFGMLMKVGGNVLHEFWPDAKRMMFHRHSQDPLTQQP